MQAASPSLGISLRAAGRTYPSGVEAVRGATLEIPAGAFVALLGPTGCGKTTLLRMIGGLEPVDAGAIEFSAPIAAGALGYCFQEPRLLPWRTVLANVALPLQLAGVGRSEREARAAELLAQVGLADFTRARPHELSGGMRMRAALARTLVTRPAVLLLDEPFGALDAITRAQLDEALRTLWTQTPMTIVLVTHAIDEAAWLADTVHVLSPRPGRVVASLEMGLPARTTALRQTAEFGERVADLHRALARGMA